MATLAGQTATSEIMLRRKVALTTTEHVPSHNICSLNVDRPTYDLMVSVRTGSVAQHYLQDILFFQPESNVRTSIEQLPVYSTIVWKDLVDS